MMKDDGPILTQQFKNKCLMNKKFSIKLKYIDIKLLTVTKQFVVNHIIILLLSND